MPPRGLSDLPEEILLYIVEAACEGEHFSKIHNLIFVNHRISRLAVPFLYRNLRDGDFVDGESDAFRKLTFTLLFDPIKAAYVHSFTLDNGDEYGQGPPLIDETSDGELKELGDAVEQLAELQVEVLKDYAGSEEAKKIWERDFLGKPLMGAFLALILGQLPNLHELTITDVNDDYWKVFEYVTDAMTAASKDVDTGVKTPFVNLEKVTMGDMNCNKWPSSTFPLTVVAKWPSVKVVEGIQLGDGDNSCEEDPDQWFLDLKPRSTNYTSISFRSQSKLLSEHLVRFLGTANALETFDYEMGHGWAWIPISTPEINRALDQHKETLISVTLHIFDWELDNEDSTFSPMSFKEYSALTHVNIAFHLLFGSPRSELQTPPDDIAAQNHILDALPGSLENLEIVQCDTKAVEAATSAVRAVLRVKEERWPMLNKVLISVAARGYESLKETQKELQAESEAHGVTCIINDDGS